VSTIMRPLLASRRARALSRVVIIACTAIGAAACSSDTARFTDRPVSIQYASQTPASTVGSAPAYSAPLARVDSQTLPAQAAEPLSSPQASSDRPPHELTGSLPPPHGSDRSGWKWDGGTAITVGQGETIESISRKYRVPSAVIMEANNISAPVSLQPGQHLVIPRADHHRGERATSAASNATIMPADSVKASAASATPGIHVVAAHESLMTISRRYHQPRTVIAKANNVTTDAKLKIGQRLIIPGVKIAAAPVAKPATTTGGTETRAEPAPPPKPVSVPAGAKNNAPTVVASAHSASPASAQTTEDASGEVSHASPSFRWPVRGRIITGFGPKTNGQQNDGINLAVPEGTSVKAADDGVVAYAGSELKGYGNLVLVRHSSGYVTAYAHASELMVKRGDQVKRGQVIAKAGQTGNVASPQLHFEVRKGATPVDPTQFLSGT
jgi:murein DD-endopeptidase MepM/ murein hydrolase activator NlpD